MTESPLTIVVWTFISLGVWPELTCRGHTTTTATQVIFVLLGVMNPLKIRGWLIATETAM